MRDREKPIEELLPNTELQGLNERMMRFLDPERDKDVTGGNEYPIIREKWD